jgi:hypothetical protein
MRGLFGVVGPRVAGISVGRRDFPWYVPMGPETDSLLLKQDGIKVNLDESFRQPRSKRTLLSWISYITNLVYIHPSVKARRTG